MGHRYESILETIGRTPVVRLGKLAPDGINLYVKVESFNPMGSVKDRMARAIIERASQMKQERRAGVDQRKFPDTVMAMIFAKSSTRTRVSFTAEALRLHPRVDLRILGPFDAAPSDTAEVNRVARLPSLLFTLLMSPLMLSWLHSSLLRPSAIWPYEDCGAWLPGPDWITVYSPVARL